VTRVILGEPAPEMYNSIQLTTSLSPFTTIHSITRLVHH